MDREACAHYKHALDQFLPPEYSEVVFEQRQTSTAEALEELLKEVEKNEIRKKEQAEKSFDGLTHFVYRSLLDAKIQNAEAVSRKIRQAFADFPNWNKSEGALRELRKKVNRVRPATTCQGATLNETPAKVPIAGARSIAPLEDLNALAE